MSTIGSLLALMDPGITPYNQQELTANRIQFGNTQNQTQLLELADLRRQQEEAAMARQFMAANPGQMVPGGGGGPLLASPALTAGGGGPMPALGPHPVTQQTVVPGQPPGAPQPVPGGQDLSRFATGGGMPGGPPQSTLGQLQPQQDPFEARMQALMAQSPGAALQVLDIQSKIQQQQLTMREKVAGAVGQLFQGVTDQASYDEARAQVQQFNPRMAAQLPPVYNKDQVQRLVKQAVDVKTSATLAIENMKAQAEIGRFDLQRQQAGYAGLGADVTGVLKGLTPEQVQAFGGRTSEKAIAYARQVVKGEALAEKGAEGAQAADITAKAQQQARLDKTVSEAFGPKATNLFDTQTLETVDSRMKVKDYEALPAGRVKELDPQDAEQMRNIRNSVPIITQLQGYIDQIYGPGGVLARMTPDERADLARAPDRWAKQYAQKYPELEQAQRFINSNAGALARALAGEKGAMAEGDVERAKAMLPNLQTSLQLWPPSKLAIQQPDTRATALRSMNSIVDLINGRLRTLLGNEQITHPKLHRYETAEEAQQATGGPGTPPQVAPPELPIPPTTQLNPNLPQPGAFGAPAQRRYVPPTPTAPTPAPAAAPPPGRRSAADLPGAPRVASVADVREAMRQTGLSRREIEEAMRRKGYTVYGSKLPLPEVTMVG